MLASFLRSSVGYPVFLGLSTFVSPVVCGFGSKVYFYAVLGTLATVPGFLFSLVLRATGECFSTFGALSPVYSGVKLATLCAASDLYQFVLWRRAVSSGRGSLAMGAYLRIHGARNVADL